MINKFISFLFIFVFASTPDLFSDERTKKNFNELDSLRTKILEYKELNNKDSLEIVIKKITQIWSNLSKEEIFEYEVQNLLKVQFVETKLEVSKSKSQMQSVILLVICLFGFIYLIYYTDKINRDKQIKKIKAASKMSKYESNLRKQISEKLHDDIGGSIIALKMRCINKDGMKDEVKLLSNIYERVREISSDLDMQHKFSQSIEDGINILVNEMCNEFDKKNINVFPDEINEIKDSTLIEDVIMTTKELITNVIKHSKASEISIDVSLIDNFINIIVQDNGLGIMQNKKWGQGLKSIQNRAVLHEGTFDIDSNKNGTTANVKFLIT